MARGDLRDQAPSSSFKNATTDGAGRFAFEGISPSLVEVSLERQTEGVIRGQERKTHITAGHTAVVNFHFQTEELGSIEGTITLNGAPVTKGHPASLQMLALASQDLTENDAGVALVTYTNGSGFYRLEAVPMGSGVLRAEARERSGTWYVREIPIDIDSTLTRRIDIELTESYTLRGVVKGVFGGGIVRAYPREFDPDSLLAGPSGQDYYSLSRAVFGVNAMGKSYFDDHSPEFQLNNLEPGPYTLVVLVAPSAPGANDFRLHGFPTEISADDENFVELDVGGYQ